MTIAGATFLSIKFDERCSTEEECDELSFAADSSFKQDRHEFSGGRGNWNDFEIPGNCLSNILPLTQDTLLGSSNCCCTVIQDNIKHSFFFCFANIHLNELL